jgi:hypothetical protein
MAEVMRACAPDEPVMVAWNAYKETESFANTRKWAVDERHVEGSLWAAFERGFAAASAKAA